MAKNINVGRTTDQMKKERAQKQKEREEKELKEKKKEAERKKKDEYYKNAKGIAKSVQLVTGGLSDVPLIKHVAKPVKVVAQVAEGIISARQSVDNLITLLKETTEQHPEWYLQSGVQGTNNLQWKRLAKPNSNCAFLTKSLCHYVVLSTPMQFKEYFEGSGSGSVYSFNSVIKQMVALRTDIRSNNNGYPRYSAADLLDFVTVTRNIRALLFAVKTRIKAVAMFNFSEPSTPYNVTRALGMTDEEVQSIASDYANIIRKVNIMIREYNILVPTFNLPLYERDEWMFSNLFSDTDDIGNKPVLSGFCPSFIMKADAGSSHTSVGMELCFGEVTAVNGLIPNLVTNLITKIRELLDIIHSTAYEDILSDIQTHFDRELSKLVRARNIEQIDPGLNEPLVPIIFDTYVNAQLVNATILPQTNSTMGGINYNYLGGLANANLNWGLNTNNPEITSVYPTYLDSTKGIPVTSDVADPDEGVMYSMTYMSIPPYRRDRAFSDFSIVPATWITATIVTTDNHNDGYLSTIYPAFKSVTESFAQQELATYWSVHGQVANAPASWLFGIGSEDVAGQLIPSMALENYTMYDSEQAKINSELTSISLYNYKYKYK